MRFVALAACRVDGFAREHDSRWCARAAGSPGLVIDVVVTVAVAGDAPDVHPSVGHCDFFLGEVQVADVAPAIVGAFHFTCRAGVVIKEQERLLLSKHERRQEKASQNKYRAGAPHARRV